MTPELHRAILAHAHEVFPAECCGVLVKDGNKAIYHPCRNVGDANTFIIDGRDWVSAEDAGKVLGIVHSHPEGCQPSPADQVGCNRSGLPWWVFSQDGEWTRITPMGWTAAGHQFVWGVQDCYTFASDHFGGLPDFIREPEFWRRSDLFMPNLEVAGFSVVQADPEPGDGLLFRVHGHHSDHCAVYLGDGLIAHQPADRLGCIEPMGRLVEKAAFVVRRAA